MGGRRPEDQRHEPRYAYPKTVEYVLPSGGRPGTLKGVVVNISKGGICLYLYSDYIEGETIVIQNTLPVTSRTASIRWIKKINVGFYKAGLQSTTH